MANTITPLSILVGELMHQRHDQHPYRFRYPYASVVVDIDQWQAQCQQAGIAVNQWGLFGLYHHDFGARDSTSWRAWLSACLKREGLDINFHRAELIAVPRFMGIGFNPLSMWYVYDTSDRVIAMVAEVSNTFGHWHHYVHHQDGQPLTFPIIACADKVFHVSPFLPMPLQYRFRVQPPNALGNYQLLIEENDAQGQRILTAVHTGKNCDKATLWQCLWQQGSSALGILIGIHWHAFKLWRKKAMFYRTPTAQRKSQYHHQSRMTACTITIS